jgi:hypothetical protein
MKGTNYLMELQKELTPKSMEFPPSPTEMQDAVAPQSRYVTLPSAVRRIETLQAEIADLRELLRSTEEERSAKERLFRDTIKREAELRREIFVEYNTAPDRKQKAKDLAFAQHVRVHAEEMSVERERTDVPVVATTRSRGWRRDVPFQRLFSSLFAARS